MTAFPQGQFWTGAPPQGRGGGALHPLRIVDRLPTEFRRLDAGAPEKMLHALVEPAGQGLHQEIRDTIVLVCQQ